MAELSVLTFNVGLLRIDLGTRALLQVPHVEARLPMLIAALRDEPADVVCLQEVFTAETRDRLVDELAGTYPYVARCDDPSRISHGRLSHGLLLLSRLPVRACAFSPYTRTPLTYRTFVRQGLLQAALDLPDGDVLHVINTHTAAGALREQLGRFTERLRDEQLGFAADHAALANAPTLLCGDLNTGLHASAGNYNRLLERGFADAYVLADPQRCAQAASLDPANPLHTIGGAAAGVPQRIDHVLLDADAQRALTVLWAQIAYTEPVVATADGPVPLSDHYAVRVGLSTR